MMQSHINLLDVNS